MRKFVEPDVADNPLYHDTWKLLKKYREYQRSDHWQKADADKAEADPSDSNNQFIGSKYPQHL